MRTPCKTILLLLLVTLSCRNEDRKNAPGNISIPPSTIGWEYSDSLRKSIQSPIITDLTIPVQAGAGIENIQKAVDMAAEKGGGTVQLQRGIHLSGPIVMKSNVSLSLEDGSILKFIPEPERYHLVYTWFEGIPCMNYSPMIYARDQVNIKIRGTGTIDGQGNMPAWKGMKYREEIDWNLLKDMEDEGVSPENRSFGEGHSLRPDLIAFISCKNIEITGVKIINAPYWTIHTVLCEHLTFSNLNIESRGYDQAGIVPESSSRMLIKNVKINGTNDGIRILSGRVKDPAIKPSGDIIIRDSELSNISENAIAIGSKVRGGVNRVFISGLKINGAGTGVSIHLDADYRGIINEIFTKDITAGKITGPFIFCGISNGSSDRKRSNLSNLSFQDLKIDSCGRAFIIDGSGKQNVYNISIINSEFLSFRKSLAENVRNLNLENISFGGKQITQKLDIDDIDTEELDDNRNDDDILDSDDIPFNDLSEPVKRTIQNYYPQVPIKEIERIITKTGVSYEIEMEPENSVYHGLLISAGGEIIRSELEISYKMLPLQVIATLRSIIKTEPSPYLIDEIRKIIVRDFTYYEITGETTEIIFLAGIAQDGSILEDRQKQVEGSVDKLK